MVSEIKMNFDETQENGEKIQRLTPALSLTAFSTHLYLSFCGNSSYLCFIWVAVRLASFSFQCSLNRKNGVFRLSGFFSALQNERSDYRIVFSLPNSKRPLTDIPFSFCCSRRVPLSIFCHIFHVRWAKELCTSLPNSAFDWPIAEEKENMKFRTDVYFRTDDEN